MKKCMFNKMLSFLSELESGKIRYSLHHHRENAIMITVAVPGERWEIEFLDDGSIEIERFISNGEIFGEKALGELLEKYSDPAGWVEGND
jgi:hypothetical protein